VNLFLENLFTVQLGVSLLIERIKSLALVKAKQRTENRYSKQGNPIFFLVFSSDYHKPVIKQADS